MSQTEPRDSIRITREKAQELKITMNNPNTSQFSIIVPFFLLLGLLALLTSSITGCSSSETRPVTEDAVMVTEPETITITEEVAPPVEKEIRVKVSHPVQYTVKKGDTLWDIASLYLQDPWYWPEIWQQNAQVQNPHLIFPGDVLTLVYVNGQPQILVNDAQHKAVQQGTRDLPVKKLSPSIHTTPLQASIPSIPGDAIRQFLSKPRVVTKEQLEDAPRIVASQNNHLILGTGSRVYIRGELDKERVRFSVFRPGDELRDPQSGDLLGYEAKYTGDVRIVNYDDPASGDLTFTEREVLIGDRLLPEDKSKQINMFFPHVPDMDISAQIISLYDAIFGVAQYQIVVINKGELDGVEVGHLLAAYTKGDTVRDRFDKHSGELVKLPNERSGLVMVFKTFDRVSYALTMESTQVIHKNDYLHKPNY
ncbi:MAG: LysM peptidoglycan-binding domain-containing protein [Gammaproteobacteria bacterium]|nr:LysM peptidoglycan-binding domain-containing protein [Gammaproteobacteria bacterium]